MPNLCGATDVWGQRFHCFPWIKGGLVWSLPVDGLGDKGGRHPEGMRSIPQILRVDAGEVPYDGMFKEPLTLAHMSHLHHLPYPKNMKSFSKVRTKIPLPFLPAFTYDC